MFSIINAGWDRIKENYLGIEFRQVENMFDKILKYYGYENAELVEENRKFIFKDYEWLISLKEDCGIIF